MNNQKIKNEFHFNFEKEEQKDIKCNIGKSTKISIPIMNQISKNIRKSSNEQNHSTIKNYHNISGGYQDLKHFLKKMNDGITLLHTLFNTKFDSLNQKIENIEKLLGEKRIRMEEEYSIYTPEKNCYRNFDKDYDINNDCQTTSALNNFDNESLMSHQYIPYFHERKKINVNNNKSLIIEKFLMDYFNKDNSNSIFYGTPKKSKIEIISPYLIKYDKKVPNRKQFIVIGKNKITFNENFKIQFIVNKCAHHFYVGIVNLDLALNSKTECKFHNWKSEASILFSSRKTIWNYLDNINRIKKKGGTKIQCNDVYITSSINFIYIKDKLKIEFKDFQTIINVNSIVNTKNDFRLIIFFEGPGIIIQIKNF